jgi:hypothetical protein
MTWTYTQLRGQILNSGEFIGTGYSGHGPGKNNPDDEAIPKVGPIPRGKWKIVRWDDHHGELGPQVAVLEPVGHDAHGRTLFRIHGDSSVHPGEASDGCIVASRLIRDQWRASGDTDILVTA